MSADKGYVASAPQGCCCPPGALPFLPEDPNYVPQGQFVRLENQNFEAYQVGNPDANNAIIVLHDIFGVYTGMHRKVCDFLANALPDYLILAPDFFIEHGQLLGDDPLPERGITLSLIGKLAWSFVTCKLLSYIKNCTWEHGVEEVFNKATTYLVNKGVKHIALLGFCWGAYGAYRACMDAQHRDMIRCVMTCHPSLQALQSLYGYNSMEYVNQCHCPQFVGATKDEPASWKPGGAVTKLIAEKPDIGDKSEFYVYPNESHGFVVRGDTKIDATRQAIEDCLNKIVAFANKIICPGNV